MRPRPSLVTCRLILVICGIGAAAAVNAQQQAPVFRTAVDLVHLDVSVLDKDRKPVRGLTAADFTIVEDSKPQSIVAFTAVDVPEDRPAPPVWSARAPVDVQTNEGAQDPEGRLFVLLLDDAMIPQHTSSLATARDVAKKFIDRVTPADRVAVVFSASGRNQGFTNDRARLIAAIETLTKGHARHLLGWETARNPANPVGNLQVVEVGGPQGDPDIMYRSASMQTLRQVAETLISAPQRRKALIFVSPGIAVDLISSSLPVASSRTVSITMKDANSQLLRDMTELYARMRRANVTIYPIDPCGNGGFEGYIQSAALGLPSTRGLDTGENRETAMFDANGNQIANPSIIQPMTNTIDWLNPGMVAPNAVQLANHMATISMDFLETAARNTGGSAVVRTNDFDAGLDRIFAENSSYYLLGYQQPLGQLPGTTHNLKVTVNDRPDLIVRTRSGYDTPPLPKPPKPGKPIAPVTPLDLAIASAVPNGGFPMRVAFAPFVVPGRKDPVVTVTLGLTQPSVKARTTYAVDLQTNVYRIDGRPVLVGQQHKANVILVPAAGADGAHYELYSSVMLPPGRYELRLSAHRALDDVSGSVYGDIEVPDFNAALSASGVVVEAAPTGAFAPADAFDEFLPVIPTSNRDFRPGQEVTAFMRLYQDYRGGKKALQPVEVKTRIVNEADAPVGEGKDTVDGSQFHVGGRAADYRFAIPVKSLPPGAYLLTFEISLKGASTITRSVQFRVGR